jgi:hypothetical protein
MIVMLIIAPLVMTVMWFGPRINGRVPFTGGPGRILVSVVFAPTTRQLSVHVEEFVDDVKVVDDKTKESPWAMAQVIYPGQVVRLEATQVESGVLTCRIAHWNGTVIDTQTRTAYGTVACSTSRKKT